MLRACCVALFVASRAADGKWWHKLEFAYWDYRKAFILLDIRHVLYGSGIKNVIVAEIR